MATTARARASARLVLLLAAGVLGGATYALVTHGARAAAPATAGQDGVGTVLAAPPDRPAPADRPAAPGGSGGAPAGVFHISGRVAGLVPGTASSLTVTVTNPNAYPIRLRTLDTGVTHPAGCPAGTLTVGRYDATTSPAVSVAARGTAHVTLPVVLTDSPTQDQSRCLAAFPLTFTGTAVQGR